MMIDQLTDWHADWLTDWLHGRRSGCYYVYLSRLWMTMAKVMTHWRFCAIAFHLSFHGTVTRMNGDSVTC